ncbi:hypothetical protein CAPTEDRAFT_224838 [Capitella teleta]|uniref:Uncharacterized protein n=1 Tax=Capitella teleta TaxID=283909 RepID=R7USC3_CAPTE|nr:hypothetical protein CAPTEDRAFT_224838 [Capitella teleta]|eukprot:ELU06311.1 hypothetical protein CAPTEDRAFT_224838 [Capitella teleta]
MDDRETVTPSMYSTSCRYPVDFNPIDEARDMLRCLIRGRCPSRASLLGEEEVVVSQGESPMSWPLTGPAGNRNSSYHASTYRSYTPAAALHELEDTVHPVYMRDSSTLRMYYTQMKNRANEKMAAKVRPENDGQTKWKVQEVDLNAWRQNIIDARTIYGSSDISKLNTASQPPPPRFKAKPTDFLFMQRDNTEMKRERSYIQRTLPRRLRSPKQIVQKNLLLAYNKPINSETGLASYGHPRYATESPPTITLGPRVKTVICTHGKDKPRPEHNDQVRTKQFCDVLGPSSCNKCIEIVNRRIASDIQKQGLPELDPSLTNMVAPRLAKLMTCGQKMLAEGKKRRRRSKRNTVMQLSSVKKQVEQASRKSGSRKPRNVRVSRHETRRLGD